MPMRCENDCGKVNSLHHRPVRMYYDYAGYGACGPLCKECADKLSEVDVSIVGAF